MLCRRAGRPKVCSTCTKCFHWLTWLYTRWWKEKGGRSDFYSSLQLVAKERVVSTDILRLLVNIPVLLPDHSDRLSVRSLVGAVPLFPHDHPEVLMECLRSAEVSGPPAQTIYTANRKSMCDLYVMPNGEPLECGIYPLRILIVIF